MRASAFVGAVVAIASLGTASPAELLSGRGVGELTPSFVVKDVTGPYKGKPICYVCEYQGAPTVIGFFRDTGEATADLVVKLNDLAKRQVALKVVVVLTAGTGQEAWLAQLAEQNGITVPLTAFRRGPQDVAMKLYKLNPEASNTLLVSTKRKVSANLVDVSADRFGQVEAAVQEMLALQ